MNSFSIAQLEQFSGIKAHTIRMWEKRYQALSPNRSEGNTRKYDNTQLKRLLNIVSLMNGDFKISDLCSMPDEQLNKIIEEKLINTNHPDETSEYFIFQLIAAGMTYDELRFEKIFSSCLLRYGIIKTYLQVIYPMLVRIGTMWLMDALSPAYEHFISNLLRLKICAAIDVLPPHKSSGDSWLLFLPENEFHEIGLLLAYYVLRSAGKKVIYLGSNIPQEALLNAVKEAMPSHVYCFLVHYDNPEDCQHYLSELKKKIKKTKIYISGNFKLISQLKSGKEFHWIHSLEELEAEIQ